MASLTDSIVVALEAAIFFDLRGILPDEKKSCPGVAIDRAEL